jgi:hypothetical protein
VPFAKREIALLLAGLAVVLVVSIVLFADGEGDGDAGGVSSLPTVDGTVAAVQGDGFVLLATRPVDGQQRIRFVVPPDQRGPREFDLAHMSVHLADGTPVRVFYRREGERLVAVRQVDAL